MKNLLVGNGINIQFDRKGYTAQQIVLRVLKNFDRDDFPTHIIVNYPYLMKNYFGELYLQAREILLGKYDSYVSCSAESASLIAFKEQYSSQLQTLKITDIAFEDYYLIHDLVCHKLKMGNPEQYYVREAMRIAYLFSIYNEGKINSIYLNYSDKLKNYFREFNNIFTTNYDSNIDSVVESNVYHIHGQFDKLDEVYNKDSFRNQLPDSPIKNISIDTNYFYLYSNAITTYCGDYKELVLNQSSYANRCAEKLVTAYKNDTKLREEIDSWTLDNNKLTANLGFAVQAKAHNSELEFKDNFHFEELRSISGTIEILGLSPWNDFHIFNAIDNSNIEKCVYYYYSKDQCNKVEELLSNLNRDRKIQFESCKEFWDRYL